MVEAERRGVGGVLGADAANHGPKAFAIVRVHAGQKSAGAEVLRATEARPARGIGAALRRRLAGLPYEGGARARRQRLLQARLALRQRRLVTPALGKQCSEHIGAER